VTLFDESSPYSNPESGEAVEQADAADEGRLEVSGSTMVGPIIVNQGKVVRPSLIRSVSWTRKSPHTREEAETPMKATRMTHLFAAALVCAIAAATAQAQTAPKMKMTTDIPAGIETPDKVDTRLGTLEFFDGFPTDASVERLYDNLDFQWS
jgi:hypothetical protein